MPPKEGGAKEIFKHVARLKYQDEDWKTRDEALARLCKLITEGALSTEGFTSGYATNLKELCHSLTAQLYDLRSVIVKSASTAVYNPLNRRVADQRLVLMSDFRIDEDYPYRCLPGYFRERDTPEAQDGPQCEAVCHH